MNRKTLMELTNQALGRTGEMMQKLQADLVEHAKKKPEEAADVMVVHVAVLLCTARRAQAHALLSGVDPIAIEQAAASFFLDAAAQERRNAVEIAPATAIKENIQ